MQDLVESTWRWRDAGTPMRRRRRIVRGEIMGSLDFSPVSPRPRKTLKGVGLRATPFRVSACSNRPDPTRTEAILLRTKAVSPRLDARSRREHVAVALCWYTDEASKAHRQWRNYGIS